MKPVMAVLSSLLMVGATVACGTSAHERVGVAEIVPGATMTQGFGCTFVELEPLNPMCPGLHFHTGIDLAAPAGTTVHAATTGPVEIGFDATAAGLYLKQTADSHTILLYCHLTGVSVGDGQVVVAGDPMAEVGSTGLSTGPHLHFEVHVDGRSVDPAAWLAAAPGA